MSLPILLKSGMAGAPVLAGANGSVNALLNACLVNGFNTQSVSSATASGGVVTFNFASSPGFSALDTVTIAGASNSAVNGQKRVQSAASNQVLVAAPGVPDGAVGGTITLKFSPLGWTRTYSGTNLGVYRQGGTSTTKRYLRVYDATLAGGGGYALRAYEAMTAISTGTGPFPTTTQVGSNGTTATISSVTAVPWVMVGTPRFFWVMHGYNGDYSASMDMQASDTNLWCFGELADITKAADAYACIVSGASGFPAAQGFIARKGSGVSGADGCSVASPMANALSLGHSWPTASGNQSLLGTPAIADTSSSGIRGFLPGTLASDVAFVNAGAVLPGAVASSITGVSGRILYLRAHLSYGGNHGDGVVLLDEDWGDV